MESEFSLGHKISRTWRQSAAFWLIELDATKGLPVAKHLSVRTANPAAYLAQKILVAKRRPKEDLGKEILYIQDTIDLFSRVLPEIRAEWSVKIKPNAHANAVRFVEQALVSMFGETTDAIRDAALAVRERALSPESIRLVCQKGLHVIFG